MTLVVAYADQEICFMVGDTLLSHERFAIKGDVGPVNGEFHCIKIQILSGSIAVAFAGIFDAAYNAICELQAEVESKHDIDVVDWLESRTREGRCEFLVLLNVAAEKSLFAIREGRSSQVQRAYIGDQTEYVAYRKLLKPYAGPNVRQVVGGNGATRSIPVTSGEMEFDVASLAMEALSRDNVGQKHKTVGAISGFVTRVVNARLSGQLEYLQAVEASNFPWEPEGGYTVLASNEPARGIGIYYRAGKVGFILPVCSRPACFASGAANLANFIQEAREKNGMALTGGTW